MPRDAAECAKFGKNQKILQIKLKSRFLKGIFIEFGESMTKNY